MNTEYEISRGSLEDAAAIAAVLKATWLVTYPNAAEGITIEDIESIPFLPPKDIAGWWVAKIDGEVVGICKAFANHVQALYVLPQHQRKGIGSTLLRLAIPRINGEEISLEVARYNKDAVDFYKRNGFKICEDAACFTLPNGKKIPQIRLIRDI